MANLVPCAPLTRRLQALLWRRLLYISNYDYSTFDLIWNHLREPFQDPLVDQLKVPLKEQLLEVFEER